MKGLRIVVSAYIELYAAQRSMELYHSSSTDLVSFATPHIFIDKVWNVLIILIGES